MTKPAKIKVRALRAFFLDAKTTIKADSVIEVEPLMAHHLVNVTRAELVNKDDWPELNHAVRADQSRHAGSNQAGRGNSLGWFGKS